MPRSKPPMPKKRTAPRPAPRLIHPVVSETEMIKEENFVHEQKGVETFTKVEMPSGLSALSIVPAVDISCSNLDFEVDLVEGEKEDELCGEFIDLELFNSLEHAEKSENDEMKNVNTSMVEDGCEEVMIKALVGHEEGTFENILGSGIVGESVSENNIVGVVPVQYEEAVKGFSLMGIEHSIGDIECDNGFHVASSPKLNVALNGNEPSDRLHRKQVTSPIRQVESAINFSNEHRGFTKDVGDPNRFSSNSLCSEVDMPFVDGSGSTAMHRWHNMESLVQSSSTSSLEKHVQEMVALRERAVEEDDSVSASWVVGGESDTEVNIEAGDGDEVASNADTADNMTVDSIDEVDCSQQQAIDSTLDETENVLQPLENQKALKDPIYNHDEKFGEEEDTDPPTLLPSPPPSLEYMGSDGGKLLGPDGRVDNTVTCSTSDLDWEYKLPAPPTGFQDEEERRDGVEEVAKVNQKVEDQREMEWVAESETASIPSTFSSAASHRKLHTIDMDNVPLQNLPNFRMGTYKASSEDGGWEDPREDFGHRRVVDDCFSRPNGRTFVMLNSDGEANSEKSYREQRKNSFETWASISSKSSLNKGHYSNQDLSSPSPYGNTSLVMTSYKNAVEQGYEPRGGSNSGSYVARVSSFGGKSSTALKRSLSSTSSLVSRQSSNDGRDMMEKFEREMRGKVGQNNVNMQNGIENCSLSNASRTVSLHDLAINRVQEERRTENHFTNGYHDENTTMPKIVSSKWKKPQAFNGTSNTKFGPKKFMNVQNLRKTSSELSINQGFTNGWKDQKDENIDLVSPRQVHHWQDHIALESHMQEPLKSIQVLRGVLPHLKKSLSSDLSENEHHEKRIESVQKVDVKEISGARDVQEKGGMNENLSAITKSNSLPRPNHYQQSSDETCKGKGVEELPKRYSYAGPPAINFGTWNERPKSEVSLKRDSDYRIGVGQAPRVREFFMGGNCDPVAMAVPPVATPSKAATITIPGGGNQLQHPSPVVVVMSSQTPHPPQQGSGPPCPPPKPAAMNGRVTVNIVSANKPEPVSRLPIVRSMELKKTVSAVTLRSKPEQGFSARPVSCKFPSDLREELSGALASLVDANRGNGETRGQGGEEEEEGGGRRRRRQQMPSASGLPPPPPPEVVGSPAAASPPSNVNLRRVGSAGGHDLGQGLRSVNGFMTHEKRLGGLIFAPVVKGFRMNPPAATPSGQSPPLQNLVEPATQSPITMIQPPPPPPPPAVVCGVALKKRVASSGPKAVENPRDQLLSAIRDFGGKENLKKTALRYK